MKSHWSRQRQLKGSVRVVREALPWWLKVSLLLFGFCLSLLCSFYVGSHWSDGLVPRVSTLEEQKSLLLDQLNQEKIRAAASRLENEALQEAVASVRQTNVALQQRISNLEEEVTYYQRVMNPIRNDKGLRIDTVEFERSADEDRFRINVVLTQLGKDNRTVIKGVLDIHFEGSQQGEKKIYSIEDLKVQDGDLQTQFRFRYYQDISEEVRIPQAFIPEKVHFTAISSGSKSMEIQHSEPWPF